ncbi:hypothetical protein LCGC14_1939030, partial [marine sediment metagenome]
AAVRLAEGLSDPLLLLGQALVQLDRREEALAALQKALAIQESAEVHINVALLHDKAGRLDQAVASFQRALLLAPGHEMILRTYGLVLCRHKKFAQAIRIWEAGLKSNPGSAVLSYHLAWWLATCPDAAVRNGKRAAQLAQALCERTGRKDALALDALAAAHAEIGQFKSAVAVATEAMNLARAQKRTALAGEISARINLYMAAKPYRQPQ